MKKIILILMLLTSAAFAQCDYSCREPYGLTSGVSRFLSNVTAQNFLAEKIGASLIKKAVKKNITSGDVKATLKSYSVRDLKAGRFKSIDISGKNLNAQGVYISTFSAATLCDFNYIEYNKKGDIVIKEDMPLSVNVEITEDDLNKTMNSTDYKRIISDLNKVCGDFFEINSTYVKLKNNKMYYVIKYNFPFVRKSKEIVLVSNLGVKNGKIVLNNTSFAGNNSLLDIDKFSRLLNYVNPLDFSAKILENKDAKFNIQNVDINENKILINGNIIVVKDKE